MAASISYSTRRLPRSPQIELSAKFSEVITEVSQKVLFRLSRPRFLSTLGSGASAMKAGDPRERF